VIAELREVAAEPFGDAGGYAGDAPHAFRLITYRTKEVYCSQGHDLPSLAAKRPYNPALLHADAMARLGLQSGDRVEIESPHGRVEAIVHASDDVAPDVVALAFGWGDPLDPRGVEAKGCNVQRLIRADEAYDAVTGLARQSAIPVNGAVETQSSGDSRVVGLRSSDGREAPLQVAVQPPSTSTTWPVANSQVARKSAASATSSGFPGRPSGVAAIERFTNAMAFSPSRFTLMSVPTMKPGESTLTRMPRGPRSTARLRPMAFTAPHSAAPPAYSGTWARSAMPEQSRITEPSGIFGTAWWTA
jgi:hypothetical protein